MKLEFAASMTAAALLHALVLFGIRLEKPAQPLPMTDQSVDVSLVDSAPAGPSVSTEMPPAPGESAPTPEPVAPAPTPEVKPTPEPVPEASPVPQATPQQEPMPAPDATPVEHPKTLPKKLTPRHTATPHAAGVEGGIVGAMGATTGGGPGNSGVGYRSNPKPEYPSEARAMREEGLVILNVDVGTDGRATAVSVKRSSGYAVLDTAAEAAVRRWLFNPARVAGLPVSSHVDVPVRFSLSQ